MEYVEYSHPDLSIFGVCKDENCIVPGLYAMVSVFLPLLPPLTIVSVLFSIPQIVRISNSAEYDLQIGAAATLAGVTRTTVSLAVIVLELTNTLNYVVPVMMGVLIAKTVADGLEKKGIYDLVIE